MSSRGPSRLRKWIYGDRMVELQEEVKNLKEAVEKTVAISATSSKSPFARYRRISADEYKPDVKNYYRIYDDFDIIREYIDDLSEGAAGQGTYTSVSETDPNTGEPTDKAKQAKDICDKWNSRFNVDAILPNVTRNMLIAGFQPIETRIAQESAAQVVQNSAIKLVEPVTVKKVDSDGFEIQGLWQWEGPAATTAIPGDKLAWFMYNPLGNDPLGKSWIRGIIKIVNTLNAATAKVDGIFDRWLGPLALWRSKYAIDNIKRAVEEKREDEDIYLGNLPEDEYNSDKLFQLFQMDPRVPFWEYLEYLDRRVYSYSRANNLWYIRNSTDANTTGLADVVARHVHSIQRELKRSVEKYWYAPLVKQVGLDEVPMFNFGAPPTGVEDLNVDSFLSKGLELAYISQEQFADILSQLGLKLKAATTTVPGSSEPASHPEVKPAEMVEYVKRMTKCMDCGHPPTIEVLWADGRAHSWFCDECFDEWIKDKKPEIVARRMIVDGRASSAWAHKETERINEALPRFWAPAMLYCPGCGYTEKNPGHNAVEKPCPKCNGVMRVLMDFKGREAQRTPGLGHSLIDNRSGEADK